MTWQEHMVCQVNLETILIQNRNLRDFGLFDSLWTKIIIGAKFKGLFLAIMPKRNEGFSAGGLRLRDGPS